MNSSILVVTPGAGFGELISRTLEDAGGFVVMTATTRSRALALARQNSFDLVVLDSDLRGISLRDLGDEMIKLLPDTRLVVIPPADNRDRFPLVGFIPDGFLSKPFFPPDLAGQFRQVLEQPLARRHVAQPALAGDRLEQQTEADFIQDAMVNPTPSDQDLEAFSLAAATPALMERPSGNPAPPQSPATPSPDWLQDPTWAARYLTRLTLETSAHAALFTRQGALWAYAGQLPQDAAQELAALVVSQPNTANLQGDRAGQAGYTRFTRLESTGEEYMLYTTHLSEEMALALVFDAQIPFSKIRAEASSLASSLSLAPPLVDDEEDEEEDEAALLDEKQRTREAVRRAAAFLSPDLIPPPEPGKPLRKFSPAWPPQPKISSPDPHKSEPLPAAPPPSQTQPSEQTVSPPPVPQSPPLPPESPAVTHLPQFLALPVDQSTEPAQVFGTSGAVYNLTYAGVLVPRMPSQHLTRRIARLLREWLVQLAHSYAWQLEHISVRPDYLLWICSVTPEVAPEQVVETVRFYTSRWLTEQFPQILQDNPSGEFWSPGYLILGTHRPPPAQVLREYLRTSRRA